MRASRLTSLKDAWGMSTAWQVAVAPIGHRVTDKGFYGHQLIEGYTETIERRIVSFKDL
jgi:hypothetical protein